MDISASNLSLTEIRRWYLRFRNDHAFRDEHGSYTVPISAFCDYAGVSRQNLYAMLRGDQRLSNGAATRLSQAIRDVIRGLRFARVNRRYQIIGPFSPLPKWDRETLHTKKPPVLRLVSA